LASFPYYKSSAKKVSYELGKHFTMLYSLALFWFPLAVLARRPLDHLQSNGPNLPLIQTTIADIQSFPALLPSSNTGASTAAPCAPVHIIVARASGEAPGEGTISSLSTLLKQKIPGATSEALVYPAKMPYSGSIPVGVANMKTAIAKYTQACPTGKLVLLGYSQGE
jgi:hypothetical protein